MKKLIILVAFCMCIKAYAQPELKSIDSTLKEISSNVGQLKDELVKEEPAPFTGQSFFEDRKGSSAIFLPSGGTFRLNTADASLKLSFVNRVSTKKLFYGFELSGKTNDGIMSLISNGNISPGAKASAVLGLQELFHGSDLLDGWMLLRLGYEGASFKLFDPSSSFGDQVTKKSFNAFQSSLSFNFKIGGTKIFAASLGYKKSNNYEDLDEIELTDVKTITDPISGTERSYESKVKARAGAYTTFNEVPLNLDYFWLPGKAGRIGVYHYWRGKFSNTAFKQGAGTGLYLVKKDNPLASIAGLVLEVSDFSKLDEGFGKTFTINFVVGFNFGFARNK